ncbi:TadE/TadG family type IV pilus assembly protein [uncultured Sphingomonas sp.]|uniref:TadE/TadG family type IV pilus assembly protein n=1 Tax=uncultured Sphingomonas sp. TaxID=158754 RepID=UPI00260AAE19|nr:TadE/TadG family type IV pilus assembly protein [uncultured Sphingomonas sp.]
MTAKRIGGKSVPRRARFAAFLRWLLRDIGGNTLAIGAAAMIPLIGMMGGALDVSRLYLTKTRMQHACDAAVLAGRRTMGGGTWNAASLAAANQFFNANYPPGAYGSAALTTSFTESGGKVSGAISATLPMTLMRVLGAGDKPVTVVCDADMRLPNTDVMFVLDTTGSMGDRAVSTDTQTKIQGLRNAVKCFYEILAKLPTDGLCTSSKPSGGTSGVQIRFGFVPYATNVNVGYLLPTRAIANRWTYQSREIASSGTTWTNPVPTGQSVTVNGNDPCPAPPASTPTRRFTVQRTPNYFLIFLISTTCTYYSSDATQTITWRYGEISHNISGLKNGTNWNTSFTLPIGTGGNPLTIDWRGCIEERRPTVSGTNFSPIPAGATDLDIDAVPTADDPATQWGPALPGLIFTRRTPAGGSGTGAWNRDAISVSDDYGNTSYFACPQPAKRLQSWDNPYTFDSYVDSLTPEGNTYHDIGILWGARLMSPTGIFAADNAKTPSGGDIERHMIFMTDGDTATAASDYSAYGIPWFDRRNVANPSAPGASLNNEVNARFEALCTAVKNKNITLWVISFGNGSNADTEARLQRCASSGTYYFKAADSAALQTAFTSIATQISQLRLTK